MRLYVHLMIGPSGSKGRTGAAAGLLGPPPRTMATFCSNIGRLTATGRVADAPVPASPGGAGFVCGTRLPGLMAPCAGQPTMVEARRRTCARGIRGRCSRAEEMFRCQWPAGPGYHHGPAGEGMRRFGYRANPLWTGRSENRVAVMPAMTEGQPEPTIAGCSPGRSRRCGGDMGEKGGYGGQQVGAASHTRRQ